MIKSGGEWISSIELENVAMSHPEVPSSLPSFLPSSLFQCSCFLALASRYRLHSHTPLPPSLPPSLPFLSGGHGSRHRNAASQVVRTPTPHRRAQTHTSPLLLFALLRQHQHHHYQCPPPFLPPFLISPHQGGPSPVLRGEGGQMVDSGGRGLCRIHPFRRHGESAQDRAPRKVQRAQVEKSQHTLTAEKVRFDNTNEEC